MELDKSTVKRTKRGLGPFTGGQLTVIVVSAIIALGLPAGAFAADSASNVFITDHATGNHASVTPGGSLRTASEPAIGSYVLAPVAAQGSNACAFLQPPPGKAFVITEVVWAPEGASAGADTSEYLKLDAKSDCSDVLNRIAGGSFAQDGVYETTYSPGLAVQHGHYLDLQVTSSSSDYSQAFVYGYFVPSSECVGTPNGCY